MHRTAKYDLNYYLNLGVAGEEVPATITVDYTPGYPGKMYLSNGDPGYPPEGSELNILKVVAKGVDLTNLVADTLNEDEALCAALEELIIDMGREE